MLLKFINLKLTNFCQHRDLEVDFSTSTTVIIGPNGFGKSNLLNACEFALTGITNNSGTRKDDISWGETKGFASLLFYIRQSIYRVERALHSSAAQLYIVEGGQEKAIALTAKAVTEELERLLGCSIDSISRCFIHQGEISAAIYDTPSKREGMFMRLFNTDTSVLRDQLQSEILGASTVSSSQAVVAELKSQLAGDIEPAINNARDLITKTEEILKEYDFENYQLLVRNYEDYQRDITANETKAKSLKKLKDELKLHTTEVTRLRKVVPSDYDSHLDKLKKDADETATRYNNARQYIELKALHDNLRENIKDYTAELKTLGINRTGANRLLEEKSELTTEIALLKNHETVSAKHVLLLKDGKCNTCNREFENAAEQLKAEEANVKKIANSILKQTAKLGKVTQDYDNLNRIITDNEARHRYLSSCIEATNKQLSTKLPDVAYTSAEAEALLHKLDVLNQQTLHLQANISEMKKAVDKVDQTEKLIAATVIDEVAAVNITIDDYKSYLECIKYVNEQTNVLTATNAELAALERQHIETTARLKRAKDLEAKSAGLNKYRLLCERAREVLHHGKLPATVNRRYIDVLNSLLSKYMQMFNSGFTAYVSETFDFMVNFAGEQESKPALRLSGGQKVVLSLAFWFSISELFTGGLGFICFDEPSVHLDDSAIEGVRDVFIAVSRSMVTSGSQLIVITHETKLLDSFDKSIILG